VSLPSILIVEDGHEYINAYTRFLAQQAAFVRAGDGPEALALLAETSFGCVVLDMRFDRAERLLGDQAALEARLGDAARARKFLEDNQGTYILAGMRDAGHRLPVVLSYDFGAEPRRFANLHKRYAPLRWLDDAAGPAEIRAALSAALAS
jgi:hypothetical protein